ncbi:uncharacterized protein BO80DRAFT_22248 [Aspergillus ibericus CBS 121593]|uniref:Uncharacterized protein n=1 Tax=Aspergillus ibericus CBS 121593 TaxID=1448316 RepID=A0A395H709_9EURO|nr:hypothetical protein BO80DRAFT_22248 [Aspergillus ibericus CBS 121593]RAL02955.1 hypothetical protein BO80DRAFT_22248 [Aspergillus ibericus CBS 121593]
MEQRSQLRACWPICDRGTRIFEAKLAKWVRRVPVETRRQTRADYRCRWVHPKQTKQNQHTISGNGVPCTAKVLVPSDAGRHWPFPCILFEFVIWASRGRCKQGESLGR